MQRAQSLSTLKARQLGLGERTLLFSSSHLELSSLSRSSRLLRVDRLGTCFLGRSSGSNQVRSVASSCDGWWTISFFLGLYLPSNQEKKRSLRTRSWLQWTLTASSTQLGMPSAPPSSPPVRQGSSGTSPVLQQKMYKNSMMVLNAPPPLTKNTYGQYLLLKRSMGHKL